MDNNFSQKLDLSSGLTRFSWFYSSVIYFPLAKIHAQHNSAVIGIIGGELAVLRDAPRIVGNVARAVEQARVTGVPVMRRGRSYRSWRPTKLFT